MSLITTFAAVTSDLAAPEMPHIQYRAILPEMVLVVAALLLLGSSALTRKKSSNASASTFTALAGAIAVGSTYYLWQHLDESGPVSAFAGAIAYDRFALFFVISIGIGLILGSLIAKDWLDSRGIEGPEFYVLAMLAAAGAMLMAAANDLIVVFLGLEILSIALYVLAGFNRGDDRSREAAIKYFVLGSFASAIFLYGIALTYGAVGTTNLSGIAAFLSENTLLDDGLLLAGMSLLAIGFFFKVSAVPFQQWTPDVYSGAPSPVVGFMAAIAKAGAFAALLRIFVASLYVMKLDWQPVVLVVSILTLIVGCTVACVQRNVKRMLAYSSISHAGFILLGLQAANHDGVSGSMFYVLTYTFVVLGTFAVVTVVGGRNDDNHDLDAYRGLGRRQPALALAFTVLLLAQAGVPPTSGFLAKFYVMSALVENGSYATAVFAMLAAAVAAFFYLRIVVLMFSGSSEAPSEAPEETPTIVNADGSLLVRPIVLLPTATLIALVLSVGFTVALGVLPEDIMKAIEITRTAGADLF